MLLKNIYCFTCQDHLRDVVDADWVDSYTWMIHVRAVHSLERNLDFLEEYSPSNICVYLGQIVDDQIYS